MTTETRTLWKIVDENGERVKDKVCSRGGFVSYEHAEAYLARHPRSKLFKGARIVSYEVTMW